MNLFNCITIFWSKFLYLTMLMSELKENSVRSMMNSLKVLMSGPHFFQFLIFVMYTVLSIRSIEQSLKHFSFEFVSCLYDLLLQLVFIYSSCYFASNLTIKLADTANIIYNTHWYVLPLRQEKMIVAIIRQGQIQEELSGYIFSTSLETFIKVNYTQF